jgi:hypothetical protein
MFDPGNIDGIREYISENMQRDGNVPVKKVDRFDRKNLTSILADVLKL